MSVINILISFVCLLLAAHPIDTQVSGSFEVREHSLSRPYPNVFSTTGSHWHLTGNTLATDRYVRLTSDTQSKAGGLWNTKPVTYPDWEMHVQFQIHGTGSQLFGDGFVIWYVRDPKVMGPVFGAQDYFNGLAIVMDTYANQEKHHTNVYPYISAIVNNGSLHYDHDRDGADINIAGCESAFRGRQVDTLVAVRYQNNRLTISTDTDGLNTWTECFSVDNIQLPTHYYFGFSAATGELSDHHDIISVHTYQLDISEQRRTEDRRSILPSGPLVQIQEAVAETSASTGWTALKIFFLIIVLVLILTGGIGAYYYYGQNRRNRGPRLF